MFRSTQVIQTLITGQSGYTNINKQGRIFYIRKHTHHIIICVANVWYHYTGGDYRLRLNIMLLVKCYSRRVVMTAHGVMYDIRYPRQEEVL